MGAPSSAIPSSLRLSHLASASRSLAAGRPNVRADLASNLAGTSTTRRFFTAFLTSEPCAGRRLPGPAGGSGGCLLRGHGQLRQHRRSGHGHEQGQGHPWGEALGGGRRRLRDRGRKRSPRCASLALERERGFPAQPSSATDCLSGTLDATLWLIRDTGDGVTPLSFSFPTPLQYNPPANTKACLYAAVVSGGPTVRLNASGFYGG